MAAIVRFLCGRRDGRVVMGAVYLHDDELRIPKAMREFFETVETQCGEDRRFDDAGYLAAKFIVWAAAKYTYSRPPDVPEPAPGEVNYWAGGPLDFCSVGLVPPDVAGDSTYEVLCASRGARPKVRKVA